MANPYKLKETVYMTAGIKCKLLRYSEEIQNALKRFREGDFGSSSDRPSNDLITGFGCYELTFGTLWIINYDLFTNRDFITLLLPEEFEAPKLQNSQAD